VTLFGGRVFTDLRLNEFIVVGFNLTDALIKKGNLDIDTYTKDRQREEITSTSQRQKTGTKPSHSPLKCITQTMSSYDQNA
jgi:hypothetical protein